VTLDLTFFAIAIPAVIFAGISKGGFGSGAAFASAAILALVLPPSFAIGVMLPLLMLMDAGAIKAYWRRWNWAQCRILMIGGVPGVALGALLFEFTNPDVFRFLIGSIAVGFVLWQVSLARGWLRVSPKPIGTVGGFVAGVAAGFTSFVSHAGGPPAAVHLLSQKPTKTEFQAATVIVFTIINAVKVIPYAFLGIFTSSSLIAGLYLAPFALLGVWAGVKLHDVISERLFFRVTYVLLLLTGGKLIWDAQI